MKLQLYLFASCLINVVHSQSQDDASDTDILPPHDGDLPNPPPRTVGEKVEDSGEYKAWRHYVRAIMTTGKTLWDSSHSFANFTQDGLVIKGKTDDQIIELSSILIDKGKAMHANDYPFILNGYRRAVNDRVIQTLGLSIDTLFNEACGSVDSLALEGEYLVKEHYGIPGWSRPWKTFQRDIFFPASDEALAKVVAAIKDLPADAWPTIPSAPVHAHAETPSQQKEYLQALQSWFEANLLTIPFLKYGYTTTYDDMYYAAVLDQMYSKGQKLGFLNDTMGFEYLTRAFVASAAFPGACRRRISEPEDRVLLLQKVRQSHTDREISLQNAFNTRWELKKAATLK